MKRFVSLIAAVAFAVGASAAAIGAGVASAKRVHAANALPTLTLALNGKSVVVGGSTVSGAVSVVTTVSGEAQGSRRWHC